MTIQNALWVGLAFWPAGATAFWASLVPDTLSPAAFVWLNGTILSLAVVGRVMWNRTRVTPSITQTLLDLERQPRARAVVGRDAACRPQTAAEPFTPPQRCPFCRSSSLTTTKTLDPSGYWRCVACGEVWNPEHRFYR